MDMAVSADAVSFQPMISEDDLVVTDSFQACSSHTTGNMTVPLTYTNIYICMADH